MGIWADRVRRRKPFITIATPVFAVAIAAMPFVMRMITPTTNGQLNLLIIPFSLVTFCILLTLAAQLFDGIPSSAIYFAIVPSEDRSKFGSVNSVISMIVGVGLMFASGILYQFDRTIPFLIVAVLLIVYWLLFVVLIEEPENTEPQSTEPQEKGIKNLFAGLKKFTPQEKKDLLFTCLCAFGLFATSNIMVTFASSYAVTILGLEEGQTIQLLMTFQIGMILMVLPGGFLPSKIGRKTTMIIGAAIMIAVMVILFFVKNFIVAMVGIALLGTGWIFINVNIMPFYSDIIDTNKKLGTVLGLTGVGSQLGAILMVPAVGWLIEKSNNNYNLVWLTTAITMVFGMIMFFLVKGGEMRKPTPAPASEAPKAETPAM
jgi:MFS family permease